MKYTNYTPFPSFSFPAFDQNDLEHCVVIIRGTFDIRPGEELVISQAQTPLVMADEHYGEINKSSVKQESDLAPFKPKCDVIVIGTAYSPNNVPTRFFPVGIKIIEADKTIIKKNLVVTGPRFWKKRFLLPGWKLTYPEPTLSVPLRYEYAHGGECRINKDDPAAKRVRKKYRLSPEDQAHYKDDGDKAAIAHAACETNTVGRGWAEKWYLKAKKLKRIPAPQIEAMSEGIKKFGKQYQPQGFGPIDRSWLPRRKYTGTYDKAWLDERWPKLPKDFDFAYNNCAHPDLQVPHLKGDEEIELMNMTSKGNLKFRLPGHLAYVLVRQEDSEFTLAPARLDTVIIDPDEKNVSLVWRASVDVIPKVRLLEARLILKENQETQKDLVKALEVRNGK